MATKKAADLSRTLMVVTGANPNSDFVDDAVTIAKLMAQAATRTTKLRQSLDGKMGNRAPSEEELTAYLRDLAAEIIEEDKD